MAYFMDVGDLATYLESSKFFLSMDPFCFSLSECSLVSYDMLCTNTFFLFFFLFIRLYTTFWLKIPHEYLKHHLLTWNFVKLWIYGHFNVRNTFPPTLTLNSTLKLVDQKTHFLFSWSSRTTMGVFLQIPSNQASSSWFQLKLNKN